MTRDIRQGEPCHVRRTANHHSPVYQHGQRSAEIHQEAVPVRWSGYYRDLQREGAIEVVTRETMQNEAAAAEKQLRLLDEKGLLDLCAGIERQAADKAAGLTEHGAHLQAETCKAGAAAQVAAMRSQWGKLKIADPTDGAH